MSHYLYKITLPGGKTKAGQVTGKTEVLARERLKKLNGDVRIDFIRPKPVAPAPAKVPQPRPAAAPAARIAATAKPAPAKPSPPPPKPVPAKSGTKLEKLLFLQSNKCFFCGRVLTKAEASVEHLQPKSGGGNNADGNVVACCVTLNRTFGGISLKEKMKIILDKAGHFACPKDSPGK